jgi:hypothetical protein
MSAIRVPWHRGRRMRALHLSPRSVRSGAPGNKTLMQLEEEIAAKA